MNKYFSCENGVAAVIVTYSCNTPCTHLSSVRSILLVMHSWSLSSNPQQGKFICVEPFRHKAIQIASYTYNSFYNCSLPYSLHLFIVALCLLIFALISSFIAVRSSSIGSVSVNSYFTCILVAINCVCVSHIFF